MSRAATPPASAGRRSVGRAASQGGASGARGRPVARRTQAAEEAFVPPSRANVRSLGRAHPMELLGVQQGSVARSRSRRASAPSAGDTYFRCRSCAREYKEQYRYKREGVCRDCGLSRRNVDYAGRSDSKDFYYVLLFVLVYVFYFENKICIIKNVAMFVVIIYIYFVICF